MRPIELNDHAIRYLPDFTDIGGMTGLMSITSRYRLNINLGNWYF